LISSKDRGTNLYMIMYLDDKDDNPKTIS
jgi:hypothetical protein